MFSSCLRNAWKENKPLWDQERKTNSPSKEGHKEGDEVKVTKCLISCLGYLRSQRSAWSGIRSSNCFLSTWKRESFSQHKSIRWELWGYDWDESPYLLCNQWRVTIQIWFGMTKMRRHKRGNCLRFTPDCFNSTPEIILFKILIFFIRLKQEFYVYF